MADACNDCRWTLKPGMDHQFIAVSYLLCNVNMQLQCLSLVLLFILIF